MMTLQSYPRCAAYLRGMKVKLDDQSMTNYWGAVILADKWTDKQLQEAGGVDFKDKSGESILGRFEALLTAPRIEQKRVEKETARHNMEDKQRVQLLAFLGSRGVKTGALKNDDDFWKAALILWPSIKREGDLSDLSYQIARLSKKQRQEASQRRNKLPEEFKGNHPAFSKAKKTKPLPEKAKQ